MTSKAEITSSGASVFKRLVKGTFWSVAATALTSAFNLLAGVVCARSLGTEAFGQMGILQSTVGFAGLLTGLGLGTTATRFVSLHQKSDPARCGRMLGGVLQIAGVTVLAGTLAVYLGADWIALAWLDSPALAGSVRICALWVLALTAGEILLAALAGFEAFRQIASLSLLRGVLVFGGTVAGLRWGLEGSLWGWSIGLGAGALLLAFALLRECRGRGIHLSHRVTAGEVRTILAYAVPTLISGLSYAPFAWLSNTLIARSPGGFEQMALLNVAYQWRGFFTYLPVSLGRAVLPLLGSSEGEGTDAARRAFGVSNLVNQVVVWTGGLALLGGSGLVLSLYGAEYVAGRWVFILVLGGAMLGYVGNAFGTLIQMRGLFRLGILGNLLSGVALLGSVWLLPAEMGAVAVGVGTLVGYFLNLTLCGMTLIRQEQVGPCVGRRIVGAAVIALLVVPLMGLWSAWVSLGLAIVIIPLSLALIFHAFARPEGLTLANLKSTLGRWPTLKTV